MKTIIAATDFGPVSGNAVKYAADMASMLSAKLVLFHAFQVPVPVSEVPVAVYTSEEMLKESETQINNLKEEITDRTGGRISVQCEVREGDMLTLLDEYSGKVKPYAVILGAESATAFERLLSGGKTVAALRRLQWPLLIIPPLARFRGFKKIGLACDLREVIESVRVQEIQEFIRDFGSELHVLHVSKENRDTYSDGTIEESGYLQEMLVSMHPRYHFIHESHVEEAIMEYAEKHHIDMLIVIPKTHTIVYNVFHKNHAKQLALYSTIPIMSLHE